MYFLCFLFFFSFLFFSSFVCPFLIVKISLVSIVQLVVGFGYFICYFISFVLITWLDKDSNLNWFVIEKLNCELHICIFCYCASWFFVSFRFFSFLKIFPWTKTCLSISFFLFFCVCIYIINISRSWIIIICYVTTKMARRTCLVRYH